MKASTHKMTYEEYCLVPDEGMQLEVIDGELIRTPSPPPRHQEILGHLATQLFNYVEAKDLGKVYMGPLDTILDQFNVVRPDILFISKERLGAIAKEWIFGPPDMVVEILARTTVDKDRRRKMAVYSQFGVQEYWIVDPEMQTLELYCQGKEGLELARRFSAGEIFESPLFPGFRIAVSSIF